MVNIFSTVFVTVRKRSLGQGNIFKSVCQEFYSQGGCACSRGVPAPGVCLLWRGCLLRGVWSGGMSGLGGCLFQGVWSGGGACSQGCAWWRPPGTATAASGTHPTGMHSCCYKFIVPGNLGICHFEYPANV